MGGRGKGISSIKKIEAVEKYIRGEGSQESIAREYGIEQSSFQQWLTVILAMLTGFFTAHSFYGKNTTALAFFKGKILFIFLPFIVAGFIYHSVLSTTVFPSTWTDILNIVVGKTGGHLYFIFMIMQYYLFAYLLRNTINKNNIWLFLIIFLIIQYAFITYNFYWNGFGVRFFLPTWIFTIYLGHLLYMYRHEMISLIRRHRIWLVVLTLISISGTLFFALSEKLYTANHLRFVLFTAILIVTLVLLLLPIVKRFSLPFSKGLTYYIYLLHPYMIIQMNKLFMQRWNLSWILDYKLLSLLYLGFIFAIVYCLSWGIAKLIGFVAAPSAASQQSKNVSASDR